VENALRLHAAGFANLSERTAFDPDFCLGSPVHVATQLLVQLYHASEKRIDALKDDLPWTPKRGCEVRESQKFLGMLGDAGSYPGPRDCRRVVNQLVHHRDKLRQIFWEAALTSSHPSVQSSAVRLLLESVEPDVLPMVRESGLQTSLPGEVASVFSDVFSRAPKGPEVFRTQSAEQQLEISFFHLTHPSLHPGVSQSFCCNLWRHHKDGDTRQRLRKALLQAHPVAAQEVFRGLAHLAQQDPTQQAEVANTLQHVLQKSQSIGVLRAAFASRAKDAQPLADLMDLLSRLFSGLSAYPEAASLREAVGNCVVDQMTGPQPADQRALRLMLGGVLDKQADAPARGAAVKLLARLAWRKDFPAFASLFLESPVVPEVIRASLDGLFTLFDACPDLQGPIESTLAQRACLADSPASRLACAALVERTTDASQDMLWGIVRRPGPMTDQMLCALAALQGLLMPEDPNAADRDSFYLVLEAQGINFHLLEGMWNNRQQLQTKIDAAICAAYQFNEVRLSPG
jgi:hypothetical protein